MIRSEKPQVEVWLALDNAVKQQQKTQYDVSPPLRLECAQERHCRYRSLRPNFHPVDFHSFVGVTRKSTVTPPAIQKEIG